MRNSEDVMFWNASDSASAVMGKVWPQLRANSRSTIALGHVEQRRQYSYTRSGRAAKTTTELVVREAEGTHSICLVWY
jgi:hypothetical protein